MSAFATAKQGGHKNLWVDFHEISGVGIDYGPYKRFGYAVMPLNGMSVVNLSLTFHIDRLLDYCLLSL